LVQTDEERKAYAREYYLKNKQYFKAHNQTHESKAKKKEYNKKYNASPEVKAKKKENESRPEFKTKAKLYRDKWNEENKVKIKEYHKKLEYKTKQKKYQQRPEIWLKAKEYYASPEIKAKTKKVYNENRLRVLQYYSKHHSSSDIPCCNCCGLNEHVNFLAIDHIAGRKQMESEPELVKLGYSSKLKSIDLVRWIIKNDFPDGFQILCHNCNSAKGWYGICPHEAKRLAETSDSVTT